jgi:hypothetical protein
MSANGNANTIPFLATGAESYIDPVLGWLINYRLDGNDSALTASGTVDIVTGLDQPDLLASRFNALGDYLTSTDELTGIGSGPFSIAFRVKDATTTAANQDIINFDDEETANGIVIRTLAGGAISFRTNATNHDSTTSVFGASWTHVVITSSGTGGTWFIYLNNVQDATGTIAAYNYATPSNLIIGANTSFTNPYNGTLDDIRVYNKVLNTTERALLLNNT